MVSRSIFAIGILSFVLTPALSHADPPIDVGSKRQLFVDGLLLESSQGAEFKVHQPLKTGETTIAPEYPWERLLAYGSVLKEGETYHMWYGCRPARPLPETGRAIAPGRYLCYARSSDGIRWEKPMLDLAQVPVLLQGSVVNRLQQPRKTRSHLNFWTLLSRQTCAKHATCLTEGIRGNCTPDLTQPW